MSELTQQELKRVFHYDPDTGIFTTLVNRSWVKAGSIAGTPDKDGYVVLTFNDKQYKAHRLVFLYMEGKFPEEGLQVDHINQIKDDNRFSNLRLVTNQENHKNISRRSDNKSGCPGVSRDKRANKWLSKIYHNKKPKHLGLFNNLDDAIAARKAAELKYNYHENHGKLKHNQLKEVI